MKKQWIKPEINSLNLNATNESDCPYPDEVAPMNHVPVPDWDPSTSYNPFDRTTCKYYVDGCTNAHWNGPSFHWPCQQAVKQGSQG